MPGQLPPLVAAQTRSSLRSVQCACLVLALKVADREHAGGLLRFMLNQVAGHMRKHTVLLCALPVMLDDTSYLYGMKGQDGCATSTAAACCMPRATLLLLPTCMQCALRDGRMATVDQADHIEACVLDALGWRLGPYFAEDVLAGNDEEMWAAAAVDGAV